MNSQHGEIQMIIGPMFSGKSTELLRRIKRYTIAKRSCLVVKYVKDIRYSDEGSLSTHDSQQWQALACGESLRDIEDKMDEYDVIGIDEGQFFEDIVEFCEELANLGKLVIVAALDGTYQRRPFGSIVNLIPLAESVSKLSAVCMMCQRDASFSLRISDEEQIELIGGADKYISVCRSCYMGYKKNGVHM